MAKPFILLTNDDGVDSVGLKQLWSALSDIADIVVVAPSKERSGSGLSVTFTRPIYYKKTAWENDAIVWSVDGTPADCVNLAFKVILDKKPDLVVSGINHGSNAGRSVLYSGTLGAAIESVMQGVPSLSFSLVSDANFNLISNYISKIVKYFIVNSLPIGTCLNVNIPDSLYIKGCRLTLQGNGLWTDDIQVSKFSDEEYVAKLVNGRFSSSIDEHYQSDVFLLSRGYITMTPILVNDLTNYKFLKDISINSLDENISVFDDKNLFVESLNK